MSFRDFLAGLFLRTPQEILVALLRALLLLVVLVLVLLLKLWALLICLVRTKTLRPEKTEDPCGKIPEVLARRPDPSIYSQSYLASQGLPVTWDNPDIWVAPAANPGAIEPDSYHLAEDTDYIVSVRAHNASTDAAIGVRVRLVYRPWSFASPDVTPVEVDAAGNEVVRTVDIPPMGAAIAQFKWHTPPLAPGESAHYCLQAHLSHPLDANLANNMGQENTQVYSQNPGTVTPGELAQLDIPVFNTARRERVLRFRFDTYEIDETDQVQLRLENGHGRARLPLSDRLAHSLPSVEPREVRRPEPEPEPEGPVGAAAGRRERSKATFGRVALSSPKSRFQLVKSRYTGFDSLREAILGRDYSLPAGMDVAVREPPEQLRLGPTQARVVGFYIKVPDDAAPGSRIPMNVRAEAEDGTLVGGVTLYFDVEA
jgi:hypothetical protein